MVLPEQMDDFSFVCERGRVDASDTEETSNRSCDPCRLAAQFCVLKENTQSFHLDRGQESWSPADNIPVSFMSA